MDYKGIIRQKLLSDIYNKLSDEEKRTLLFASQHREVMQALYSQQRQTEELSKKIGSHPFASDLLANVAGNAITESLIFIGSKLFKLK